MEEILFREKQKFSQPLVWIIFGILISFNLYTLYQQLILKSVIADRPIPDFILISTTVTIFGMVGLFILASLTTEVDEAGILFGFKPFFKRRIEWENVQQIQVIDYGFIGGWGLRFTSKYGTVYNVRGRYGLSILLKNGKKLMIGTQKPEELSRTLPADLLTNKSNPGV